MLQNLNDKTSQHFSSSLGKPTLQIISSSKKSNISTGRTVPKKITLNTTMIQVVKS